MAKSKINIELSDDIKSLELTGCVLSADDVSLSIVPDVTAVDDDGKVIHQQHKIDFRFPLENVSMQRIMVQALNNNKTDVTNNLRRRINNEFKDTPNNSALLQELLSQVNDKDIIELTLLGFPGVYPDVPLTPEQIARLNEQAILGLPEDEQESASDKQIAMLQKIRNKKKKG